MHYTSPEVYEFISKQTWDPIVEWKTCSVSGTKFPITQKDLEFYDKMSPIFSGKKYKIPTPKLCPEERQRKLMMFRNERNLYRRKDINKRDVISMFSEDKEIEVIDLEARYKGDIDYMEYGLTLSTWETSVFDHMQWLLLHTPRVKLNNMQSQNCPYGNAIGYCKDCYLSFAGTRNEQCHYSSYVTDSDKCMDCLYVSASQNCYNSITIQDSSHLFDCKECSACTSCYDCFGCVGCSFCIWCTNLKNKSYHINNKPVSKEEFEWVKKEYKYWVSQIWDRVIYSSRIIGSEDCYGSEIRDASNVVCSHNIINWKDSKYCVFGRGIEDVYDSYATYQTTQRCYMVIPSLNTFNCIAVVLSTESNNLYYSDHCYACSDCFGCVGLRNKQYCIFNKQYSKQEYDIAVSKIIEQMQEEWTWWEFFDTSLSLYGYNETVAQQYYPLTKQQAEERGYKRRDDEEKQQFNVESAIRVGQYTWDQRSELRNDDSILNKIIICESTWKPFRVIKQEVEFYRKYNIPLPTHHPDVRHAHRLQSTSWSSLHMRTCDAWWEVICSPYPSDYSWSVYCEKHYQEVYV